MVQFKSISSSPVWFSDIITSLVGNTGGNFPLSSQWVNDVLGGISNSFCEDSLPDANTLSGILSVVVNNTGTSLLPAADWFSDLSGNIFSNAPALDNYSQNWLGETLSGIFNGVAAGQLPEPEWTSSVVQDLIHTGQNQLVSPQWVSDAINGILGQSDAGLLPAPEWVSGLFSGIIENNSALPESTGGWVGEVLGNTFTNTGDILDLGASWYSELFATVLNASGEDGSHLPDSGWFGSFLNEFLTELKELFDSGESKSAPDARWLGGVLTDALFQIEDANSPLPEPAVLISSVIMPSYLEEHALDLSVNTLQPEGIWEEGDGFVGGSRSWWDFIVAESDLPWGSDRGHTVDNVGRPETDESRAEGSFSIPGTLLEMGPAYCMYGEITFEWNFDGYDNTTVYYSYQLAYPGDERLPPVPHERIEFYVYSIDENNNNTIQTLVTLEGAIVDDRPVLAPPLVSDPIQMIEIGGMPSQQEWSLGMSGAWLTGYEFGADGPSWGDRPTYLSPLIMSLDEKGAPTHGHVSNPPAGITPDNEPWENYFQLIIKGNYGTLHVSDQGEKYTYIIDPNKAYDMLDSTYSEVFNYELCDVDGSGASGKLTVEFGKDSDFGGLPTLSGDFTDATLMQNDESLIVGGSGNEVILTGKTNYSIMYGGEGIDSFGWNPEMQQSGKDYIQDFSAFSGERLIFSNLLENGQSLDDFLQNNITNATANYDGVFFTLNYGADVQREVAMHFTEQETRDYTDWIDVYVSQAGDWEHEVVTHFLKGICA